MSSISVQLHPVSFSLESGHPRFVSLSREDEDSPICQEADDHPERTARFLLDETIKDLLDHGLAGAPSSSRSDLLALASRSLALAGAEAGGDRVCLMYTSGLPMPVAEPGLSIVDGSPYHWRTVSSGRTARSGTGPHEMSGADAIVLDWWRQAFEETDMALDFVGDYLSLHQLRGMYDAIWGYPQDPSGFKRWAVDRRGAFQDLLAPVDDPSEVEGAFFRALGGRLSPEAAARAGATLAAGVATTPPATIALPIAMAAAQTVNRLYKHRGPEPTWYRKTALWQEGPTWIENLYPPRPCWTRWEARRGKR